MYARVSITSTPKLSPANVGVVEQQLPVIVGLTVFLLLSDGVSFLLLTDGVSLLQLSQTDLSGVTAYGAKVSITAIPAF